MESFDIKFTDVYGTQNRLDSYVQSQACPAFKSLESSIVELVQDARFSGLTADSIKAYFSQIHANIARGMQALFEAIEWEYVSNFANKFYESSFVYPTSEARWSASDMQAKMAALRGQENGNLESSIENLKKARNCIPSDVCIGVPDLSPLTKKLDATISNVRDVKNAVQEIDDAAERAFRERNEAIISLKAEIERALAFCTSKGFSPSKYGTSPKTKFDASALLHTTDLCIEKNNACKDAVKNSNMIANLLQEEHDQILQIEQWETINAVASTAALIASGVDLGITVAALFVPGVNVVAVAKIGVSAAGFVLQFGDTAGRVHAAQTKEKANEPESLDLDAAQSIVDGTDGVLSDTDYAMAAKKETDSYVSFKATDAEFSGEERRMNAGSVARSIGMDFASDIVKPASEEAALSLDLVNSSADALEATGDLLKKGSRVMGAGAIVGAASDATVAIGDYQIGQSRSRIGEIDNEIAKLRQRNFQAVA